MALSAIQKASIRDHLCVPFAGIPNSTYFAGLRSILTVGQLEMYLNSLQAEEECKLTGNPFGQVNIYGTPVAGQTVTATINGTAVTYTVQASDATNKQPLQAVAGGLAQQIVLQSLANITAASGSNTGSGNPSPAVLPNYGQVTIVGDGVTFTLTASATGGLGVAIPAKANGQSYPWPNTSVVSSITPVQYGYIAICDYLQSRILQADTFLSFAKADVVEFNKYEIDRRIGLYDVWRKKMGVALSVGGNPAGTEGMGSGFGLKIHV